MSNSLHAKASANIELIVKFREPWITCLKTPPLSLITTLKVAGEDVDKKLALKLHLRRPEGGVDHLGWADAAHPGGYGHSWGCLHWLNNCVAWWRWTVGGEWWEFQNA